MPAVTVPDILTLPALDQPGPESRPRQVVSVTTAPRGFEGEGFPVRRAFAGVDLSQLDPFIHLDQMGEIDYAPGEPKGTSWHPHRGFETVTYMIDGVMQHQDSIGGGGVITNGATQWMTAGGGILHKEAPPEEVVVKGGLFHGFQLWVNLPSSQKLVTPRYQDIEADAVSLARSEDGGTLVRVIAGDVAGQRGPGITHTPIALAHATLSPGAQLRLPWPRQFNALVYALSGSGTVGVNGQPLADGQLAVLQDGDELVVAASARETLDVLVLGGQPIGEPVAWYGPFVMNTKAELQQAMDDFRAGRLGQVPAETVRRQGPSGLQSVRGQ